MKSLGLRTAFRLVEHFGEAVRRSAIRGGGEPIIGGTAIGWVDVKASAPLSSSKVTADFG
jgi:hypothetical protein